MNLLRTEIEITNAYRDLLHELNRWFDRRDSEAPKENDKLSAMADDAYSALLLDTKGAHAAKLERERKEKEEAEAKAAQIARRIGS